MKQLKGIAIFDLDGTLLDGESKITAEVAAALAEIKRRRILPLIATGRTVIEVTGIMKDAGIDSVIAMNGMYIQVEGKAFYSETINPKTIRELLNFARTLGDEIAYYNHDHIWMSDRDDPLVEHYSFFHGNLPPVCEAVIDKEPINMLLVGSDKPETDHLYSERFPSLNFFRNSPYSIDTVAAGVDKGTAIKKMVELLHAEDLPTYGFGDGGNDVKLLNATKHKTAMGNAIPAVKEVADFITTANTDHGIINAFKHWGLLEKDWEI